MKRWKQTLGTIRFLGPDTKPFRFLVQEIWHALEERDARIKELEDRLLMKNGD